LITGTSIVLLKHTPPEVKVEEKKGNKGAKARGKKGKGKEKEKEEEEEDGGEVETLFSYANGQRGDFPYKNKSKCISKPSLYVPTYHLSPKTFRRRRKLRKKDAWSSVSDITFVVNVEALKGDIGGYYTLGVMVDEVFIGSPCCSRLIVCPLVSLSYHVVFY
jgi:hypothetical protein